MPGAVGIQVGGATVAKPGVYVQIDASAMIPSRPGPGGFVGVAGPADGGIPNRVYEFRSYKEALDVIRAGETLSYLRRIFNPSPDLPGASLVRFVRIGAPTRASLVNSAGLDWTSVDYGRHTNGLSIQIAAGTSSPWVVTVRKRLDGFIKSLQIGNGIEVLSSGTLPEIEFDHATREVSLIENSVVLGTFDYITDTVTLTNLVNWINSYAGWSARVKGDPTMPVRYMDNPVGGTAIGAVYTALEANQGQLIWQLGLYGLPVTAALNAGTVYGDLAVVPETYLSGGTGTSRDTFTSTHWTDALTALSAVEVHHLFLCSSDATVQALGYQHTLDMRTVLRKRYRIYYTGGGTNQTVDLAIAAAPTLDGPCVYCWNGTTVANPITGEPENLGGLGTAAQVCGLAAGNYESEPLTNKALIASNIENINPADSDIDRLLIAGVTPVALDPVTGRPTIVQALTTWQGGANVAYRKLHGLRIQDAIARGFQRVLSQFIGYPLDLTTGNLIKAACAKFLDQSIRSPQNPGGFLTPGTDQPAWENLSITGDGIDLWDIQVEVHPVGETTYIKVAVKLTPAAITL